MTKNTARRFTTIFAAGALALALGACGKQSEGDGAATAVASEAPGASSSILGEPTPCSELIDAGWKAPETDPNITYDGQNDVAVIDFTKPRDSIIVAPARDGDCGKLDDIGPLLTQSVTSYHEVTGDTCKDAAESLQSGRLPERDGVEADPTALEKFVAEDCPDYLD